MTFSQGAFEQHGGGEQQAAGEELPADAIIGTADALEAAPPEWNEAAPEHAANDAPAECSTP